MSIDRDLHDTLASWPLFSQGERRLEVSDGEEHLTCVLVALDSLACAFSELTITSSRLTNLSAAQLKETAEKLSRRLTYLLEPISPIETDSEGCTVQMRSNPPSKDENRTDYYELLVSRSGQICLKRYSRAAGRSRAEVAAHVTRQVLRRLASDFSAVIS